MSEACPACGATRCVDGSLSYLGDDSNPATFHPRCIKWFSWASVRLQKNETMRACQDCGLVWSKCDPLELQDLLLKRGNK